MIQQWMNKNDKESNKHEINSIKKVQNSFYGIKKSVSKLKQINPVFEGRKIINNKTRN